MALYRLWLGSSVDSMKCLTQGIGDGQWGELHDNYFLAGGGKNELAAVFARLAPEFGQPVYGGKHVSLSPLSDKPLPATVIDELKHLPRADSAKDKTN